MDSIYRKALLVAALCALPAGLVVVADAYWPNAELFQPNRFYLGTDFVNYWSGGRLALEGRADVVYDIVRYQRQLAAWFTPLLRPMNFSYPPHALLALMPAGALSYFLSLAMWSLAGVAVFIAVALGGAPERKDVALLAAIVLAPVVWCNVVLGQSGLFLAALFVGALRALPARPLLAGVLIGALTVKPQLGLLLAPMLIVLGEWRAFAAAAASAAFLAGLSLAAFGLEPWRVYLTETAPYQWHFIDVMDGFYRFQMITPYTLAWFIGLPVRAALAFQGTLSLLIAAAAFAVLRSAAAWPLKATVVAFGSVLMVPYVLAYDLAIPLAALVWCLRANAVRTSAAGVGLIGAAWALPFGLGVIAQTRGIPLLPLVLLACFGWLVCQALGWRPLARPEPLKA